MAGTPGAGSYFPQAIADDGTRLDDALGPGEWLIVRSELQQGVRARFRPQLEAWFAQAGVAAVLVRPDRYIFGTGEPTALASGWKSVIPST